VSVGGGEGGVSVGVVVRVEVGRSDGGVVCKGFIHQHNHQANHQKIQPPQLATAIEPQLSSLDGPSLADAAWALARLGAQQVPAPWLGALVTRVDQLLEQDEQDGSSGQQQQQQQQQGTGVQAAAGGLSSPGAFQLGGRALAERAAQQASGFAAGGGNSSGSSSSSSSSTQPAGQRRVDARSLAVLIWSLARLGHRPPRSWLLAFKAVSGEELGEEPARRLARFIAGALLQHQRRETGQGQARQGQRRRQQQRGVHANE